MKTLDVYVLRHRDHDRHETIGVYTSMLAAMIAARNSGFFDGKWSENENTWTNGMDGEYTPYPLIIERVVMNKLPTTL